MHSVKVSSLNTPAAPLFDMTCPTWPLVAWWAFVSPDGLTSVICPWAANAVDMVASSRSATATETNSMLPQGVLLQKN